MLKRDLYVSQNTFRVTPSARTMEFVVREAEKRWKSISQLPEDWRFARYTLAEFAHVSSHLSALGLIHFVAANLAIQRGVLEDGFGASALSWPRVRLESDVTAWTNLPPDVVQTILTDLTLGERGIRRLDIALQPLVPISPNTVIASPQVLMHTDSERNLLVLVNKLPDERAFYDRVKRHKEEAMRARLAEAGRPTWRHYDGPIPEASGDLDLAIVDDASRSALLLELKWFIAPAEVRERLAREQECARGVAQLDKLARVLCDPGEKLRSLLGIDRSYHCVLCLVSANWVPEDEQIHKAGFPILRESQLIEALELCSSLDQVSRWLEQRAYLPVEGRDFETTPGWRKVGRWSTPVWRFNLLRDRLPIELPRSRAAG
jgi:hypothetical protein